MPVTEEKLVAVLERLIEIRISLARLEQTQETVMSALEQRRKEAEKLDAARRQEIVNLENKIEELEKRINYAAGAIAVVVSVITFFGQTLIKALKGDA